MTSIVYETRDMEYQSPSLVIFAEGKVFFKAAGTFPENDGRTGKKEDSRFDQVQTCTHIYYVCLTKTATNSIVDHMMCITHQITSSELMTKFNSMRKLNYTRSHAQLQHSR